MVTRPGASVTSAYGRVLVAAAARESAAVAAGPRAEIAVGRQPACAGLVTDADVLQLVRVLELRANSGRV
jgi:hypothetical protein